MISTVSQAKYLAHRLTKESKFGEIEKLIPVYLKSGIEVYPHQIAAAYFAVSNPFSKGFILCDEVGLGKAIEAMLVIVQYYYSGRNKIAVVVPPLLIPQWQRLISDKFDLPCKVIEKDFESETKDEIVLISYTQAAEECESLSKLNGILPCLRRRTGYANIIREKTARQQIFTTLLTGCKNYCLRQRRCRST